MPWATSRIGECQSSAPVAKLRERIEFAKDRSQVAALVAKLRDRIECAKVYKRGIESCGEVKGENRMC